jgi:hypothetical protein
MNAEFFVLAFTAALNAEYLSVDLMLIENERPRAMFACILAGGIGTAVAIGLIDVLVLHADLIKAQEKPSAGVNLALGIILLVVGALLVSGLLPVRRRAKEPTDGQRSKEVKPDKESRILSVLRQPRLGFAWGVGVICGLPGVVYLTALHNLETGNWSTATRVVGVFVFVIIEFLLIIVPWLMLATSPERTAALLRRTQGWLSGHVSRLTAGVCLLLGAYLAINGLVNLL